jgi:hypothetical protein
MPKYAVTQYHDADICPMTNKRVRDFFFKVGPNNAALANKLGVRIINDIHLDPDHKAFMLFEAPTAEAVRDYVMQAGYMHFTRMDFHLVTDVQDLVKAAANVPTLYE